MNLGDFRNAARAHPGAMVPVVRELLADTITPVSAFLRLRARSRRAFLLESVEGGERIGRYSFLGMEPFARISAAGGRVDWEGPAGSPAPRAGENFFDALRGVLSAYRAAPLRGLPPFTGGAVGYIGYDAVRYLERIPDRHPPQTDLPDALFHFYDTVLCFDRARHRLVLIAQVHPASGGQPLEPLYQAAVERLDRLEETLLQPVSGEESPGRLELGPEASMVEGMESSFTREGFQAAVERAQEHIKKGDAFQIVLSQAFRRRTSVDPFQVYRALRAFNPSPYLFYLTWDDHTALFGSSPEILVKVEGRTVSVRPIAGTRRRGGDPEEDRALERDLLADEKELAEHRMLVDLGRNDVGRVCRFGTVRVSRLMEVERYSHVMHIVSQVDGELRDGLGALDAFCAGFPAGTVSGAPKIRAMEIIDELETTRRGIYAGAVGYLDFAGNLDTCIAIRTLVFHRGEARLQAGAGIVADSVPEREYWETIHKASALYEAIRHAERHAERLAGRAEAGRRGKEGRR